MSHAAPRRPSLFVRAASLLVAGALAFSPMTSLAQEAGAVVTNGTSTGITTAGFLFEPEVPFTSLKNVPTWNELEQLLDNPYAVSYDPSTPGNDQGYPSYRATGITRRPGFGVTLPPLLVHPLNYNPTTGEEMRLINRNYPGGEFEVTNEMVEDPPGSGTFVWTRMEAEISPGSERVTEDDETAIDYNNPIEGDTSVCVTVTELNPPEGSLLCGGDPGEPGYTGFGVLNEAVNYSTPGVPLPAGATPGTVLSSSNRLYDPARGYIQARNATSGAGGLRKPSLRIPDAGGTPGNPNFLINTDPNDVTDSTENDYIRDRTAATALGKALFWDMQVGSDGVQSCGTCHFNGTGTDTRTKNQLNPNHLGDDGSPDDPGRHRSLEIGDTASGTVPGSKAANYDLKASDFPFHKLTNPDVAGDPGCGATITANVSGIPYDTPTLAGYRASQRFSNPVTGVVTVCDAGNIVSDANDVASSMGVVFSPFTDIAPIGQFQPPNNGVRAVMPDIRTAGAADPLPIFQGLRRVEPRNTPTMQAAGFNFDNFWDGRARHDFNGGSVFGAADPQTHVFVNGGMNALVATRQIIRFTSIASLATGPGLSEFEMSFAGRNWAKIGKKLLQGNHSAVADPATAGRVVPLANQLVATNDSVIGPYSNQGGSACATLPAADRSGAPGTAVGKPGLCISYVGLIKRAFRQQLWMNAGWHLNGCYSSGTNTPQCTPGSVAIPVLASDGSAVVNSTNDPFDGYVLTPATGVAVASNTNHFNQMEGNFSLFWGLALNTWIQILVPDNTPFDQVLDANPGAFMALGEPGEPGLVNDLLMCGQPGADPNYCFTEVGNFKRDSNVRALQGVTGENTAGGHLVDSGGTRVPGSNAPDPLLGLDIFFSSNLSLKNPNFRTGRCGECHAIPTLTDHTMPFTSKINLMDAVAEFATPGVELIVEPLARLRVITGFLLEAEINENGQDAVERRIVDQSIVPNPVDGLAYPGATAEGLPGFGPWTGADAAFLDNGMYNLGVRPINEDLGRGGNDAFGWPLSLSTLMMKNLGGPEFNPGGDDAGSGFAQPAAPGVVMSTFDPAAEGFGLFEETAQDEQINPGFDGEPANPLLPPYLGPFANNITVGDFPPEMDEAGGAIGGMVNTLTDVGMIEGFMDTLGPFNPGNVSAEVLNFGGFSDRPGDIAAQMGTWPNVNRVGRMGSFKAPQLRSIELTGPYFHNGGKLTLRQVVDFYTRGGDFPVSNAPHRDFNLVNMDVEIQSNLSEAEKVALVDFLLELTDERNRFDRAPFDHPQVIVPVDGTAPDNTTGRAALLANPKFKDIPAVGASGQATPEPTFLNVQGRNPATGLPIARLSGAAAFCNLSTPPVSHYCH